MPLFLPEHAERPSISRKTIWIKFDGKKTRVGDLEFEVTKTSISTTTGIPISGENWFRAMVLCSPFVKDLFCNSHME
jgi:hypothetical protein